jgi:Zn-dependent protease with chaperone function
VHRRADTIEVAPPPNRAPRLNPFAFPSDTDFRFVLLIISVLSATVLLYSLLYDVLPPTAEYKRAEYARCVDEARAAHPGQSLVAQMGQLLVHSECTARTDAVQAGFMLGGLVLVAALALGAYWLSPGRVLRSRRLEMLPVEDASDLLDYLENLCRETGLSCPPQFVSNPLDRSTSGLAFGRRGRYYVGLGGGLVDRFYTDRDIFRAVVLHELAHLRNGDVDKAYATVATWHAFLIAALAPCGLVLLLSLPQAVDLVAVAWRVLALAALVLLMRNAVLRARELDADARASIWDGPVALGRVLESLPRPPGPTQKSILRVHPDPVERRRSLQETERLLRMGFWDGFGTGCAGGIAMLNITALLNLVVTANILVLAPLTAALVVASLTVGVVGMGVWRSTFAGLATGEPARGAGRLGLGLGLGLMLGQKLSFADGPHGSYWSYFPAPMDPMPVPSEYQIGFELVWAGLLLASMFFFLRWVAAGASTWLEVSIGDPSPRPAYRAGLVVAGGLLVAWLGVLYAIHFTVTASMQLGTGFMQAVLDEMQSAAPGATAPPEVLGMGMDLITAGHLAASIMVVSLWAVPLAPWLRRRNAAAVPSSWAFLDPVAEPLSLSPQAPLRPDRALRWALVGGATFWAITSLVFAVCIAAEQWSQSIFIPGDQGLGGTVVRASDVLDVWTVSGQLAFAVLLQLGLAAIVPVRVARLGALHGLLATCVSGWIMAVGAIGIPALLSARMVEVQRWSVSVEPWVAWSHANVFTTWGPLLILPVAKLASVAAAHVRRRSVPIPRPGGGPIDNGWLPAISSVTMALALVFAPTAPSRGDLVYVVPQDDSTVVGVAQFSEGPAQAPSVSAGAVATASLWKRGAHVLT